MVEVDVGVTQGVDKVARLREGCVCGGGGGGGKKRWTAVMWTKNESKMVLVELGNTIAYTRPAVLLLWCPFIHPHVL